MSTELEQHSTDRLSFTLFLAAAIHAVIILGVTFTLNSGSKVAPTLNITLATHKAKNAPEEADFLAQHNQEASGTEKEVKELTTNKKAEFIDVNINDVNPLPQQKSSQQQVEKTQIITTTDRSFAKENLSDSNDQKEKQDQKEGEAKQDVVFSTEYKSLSAKLDKLKQTLASEPRIRRYTSVSSKASIDAEYLHNWAEKIEIIGNKNFPEEALRQGIAGDLRLSVLLKPNGSIEKIEILQSSGYPVLDNAAIQIVQSASPFEPFPQEIRKEADFMEIIRTLKFEITGLVTSQ